MTVATELKSSQISLTATGRNEGAGLSRSDASSREWNDCVSSVRVAPGWRATLYRGANNGDDALEITEDVANLQLVRQHDCDRGGLNDCVSSVRVRRQ